MAIPTRAIKADDLRMIKFNQINSIYRKLGSALTRPLIMITLKNTTNVGVYISEDGSNDHYYLPKGSSEIIDLQSAATNGEQGHKKIGLQFYIRSYSDNHPRSGNVYIQGQYT